jgi:hypothetical protein
MRSITRSSVLAVILLCTACASSSQSVAVQDARAFFESYQSLGVSYDPSVADAYCDGASIRYTRIYPDGQQRVVEMSGAQWKGLIRSALPLAQARGDYSTYSNVSYTSEGNNVRITATRYSVLKNYSSPSSWLVGECGGRDWTILEEVGETRP